MIISKIQLHNFMGYKGSTSIDFEGKKIIAICGKNESGKSSILQAISYVLFGKTRAKKETQLIHAGADEMFVEMHFDLNGDKHWVRRGRTSDNKSSILTSFTSETAKPSHVSAQLKELLKLDYDDFQALLYFKQGDIHQFMSGNKKAFFQRWASSLRLWAEYKDIAKHEANLLQSKIEKQKLKIDAALQIRNRESQILTSFLEYEKQASIAHDLLMAEQQKYQEAKQAVQDLRTPSAIEMRIDDLSSEVRTLEQKLKFAKEKGLRLKAQIESSQKGLCPVLPDTPCRQLREHNENIIINMEQDLEFYRAEYIEKKDAIEQLHLDIQKLREELKVVSDHPAHKNLIAAQKAYRESRQTHKKAQSAFAFVQQEKEQLLQSKKIIANARKKITELEQELWTWNFVQIMCGDSGIPSKIMEIEIAHVEHKCNWVLEKLGYKKRIQFKPYKELSTYEKVCACGASGWKKQQCTTCGLKRKRKRKNEPTVSIVDGDSIRPFELESGGAQVIQSFAVRLACSLFLSSMLHVRYKFVLLDEVFAMLDRDNRQTLMELILDKLGSVFGLEQQFVVSHHEDIVNSVEHILLVEKKNGVSKVRWL